jgi:hypothetical protein
MRASTLLCHDCGRRWSVASDRRYTALGLRLRRAARHSGVRRSWAHPRPAGRCPSCSSASVSPVLSLREEEASSSHVRQLDSSVLSPRGRTHRTGPDRLGP